MLARKEKMYKLIKLGDDSFTVRAGDRAVATEVSYEEAVRQMLYLDIPGAEIMKAQTGMELCGQNCALFTPSKRFFGCTALKLLN